MTAITTGPVAPRAATTGPESQLLRFALRADATLCAGLGLFVAMAADPLSRLSGLSPTAEWIVGASLVAYGALLYLAPASPMCGASASVSSSATSCSPRASPSCWWPDGCR